MNNNVLVTSHLYPVHGPKGLVHLVETKLGREVWHEKFGEFGFIFSISPDEVKLLSTDEKLTVRPQPKGENTRVGSLAPDARPRERELTDTGQMGE